MAKNGNSQTSTSTASPWKEQEPYLKEIMSGAQSAYASGKGFKYPGFSTVVPFAGQTTGALGNIESLANQGNPLAGAAQNQALGILGSGGMSDWQKNALEGTYGVATGQNQIGTEGDYRGLLNSAGQPGAIAQNLGGYASGANITGGSPQFKQQLDYQSGQLADDINRGFSNSGRYGSMSQVNELGDQIGRFRNDALASEIAREQGLQMQAAGMLSGEQQQGLGNQLGILGNIGNVQGANIANQVGAGGQINQAGNQAANQVAQFSGLAPSIYDQQFAPAERLASVGAQYEDLSTRQMQDQINRFNAQQNEPWSLLNAYQSLVGGAGSLGGQTSTSVPGPGMLQQILGGGIAGLGLLGGLGGF